MALVSMLSLKLTNPSLAVCLPCDSDGGPCSICSIVP
jgi:hypothetical protein